MRVLPFTPPALLILTSPLLTYKYKHLCSPKCLVLCGLNYRSFAKGLGLNTLTTKHTLIAVLALALSTGQARVIVGSRCPTDDADPTQTPTIRAYVILTEKSTAQVRSPAPP